MTTDPGRLRRLANAQAKLSQTLELSLVREVQRLTALQTEATSLSELVERTDSASLPIRSNALRRLIECQGNVLACQSSVAALRRELMRAKGRRDVFQENSSALKRTVERKEETMSSLEAAVLMAEKASRKATVVK